MAVDLALVRASDNLALVRACEERIVNCWPAVETLLVGGFVVRFAHGYSGRANSATPIEAGADLTDDVLGHIEALYRAAGLPSVVRVTPLIAAGLEARLMARGYRLRDQSLGMVASLAGFAPAIEFDITIDTRASDVWLDGVSALQSPDKRNPAHLADIVRRIRVKAGFASISEAGKSIGFGMVAIDRGMGEIGSIIIASECRGRGVGKAIVSSLMAHAREAGAQSAFLQVEQGNAPAVKLYEGLGFSEIYAYRTLIRDL